jgi:hypothetical protein
MDREELINKLQVFKKTCSEKGYIYDELTFDEAYPDIVPTSFIVNVVAKKSWLYSTIGEALDKLIDVLWDTAEKKTRESVFTLSLYTLEEMVNSERLRDREQVATNPDLTSEQIEKLFRDPKISVKQKIINNIQTGELTEGQILRLLAINDKAINDLLNKRFSKDKDFSELVLSKAELKAKMVAIRL